MSIKLAFMKIAVKAARKKLQKRLYKLPIKGERFMVPRKQEKDVMTYLYRPAAGGENLPVVFNVHGGAWVGGDALLLDTQSQEMADRLGAFVVNINYVKADVKPFPYAQYEIRDTVCYFAEHAGEYAMDVSKFTLMGYSAGGHLCACAAQMLQKDGIRLAAQVLCYPFLDFTFAGEEHNEMTEGMRDVHKVFYPTLAKTDLLVSPGLLPLEEMQDLAPAIIITCGPDALKPQADRYYSRLKEAGNYVKMLDYPESLHGFLECNYPETEEENAAKNSKQEAECKRAEADIEKLLLQIWTDITNKSNSKL